MNNYLKQAFAFIRLFVLIIIGLAFILNIVQVQEYIPDNAIVYLCKDNTFSTPPCIRAYGIKEFGFLSIQELKTATVTKRQLGDKIPINKLCKEKYGVVGDARGWLINIILGYSNPRWNENGTSNW